MEKWTDGQTVQPETEPEFGTLVFGTLLIGNKAGYMAISRVWLDRGSNDQKST